MSRTEGRTTDHIPAVSVLMTVYNGERFLRAAVLSLLRQGFGDFEVVLVDNGCTDGSSAVIAEFDDPRIRAIRVEHTGRTEALNFALGAARADLVAIQDADDISMPTRLGRQVEVLRQRPEISLVASGWEQVDEHDSPGLRVVPPLAHEDIVSTLVVSNPIAHSSVMYRRETALAVGGYPCEFAYAQDFSLIQRLAEIGHLAVVDDVLVQIRHHPDQASAVQSMAVARTKDCARLYRLARRLPGVSREALRAGTATVAAADVAYAYALRRSGKLMMALAIALRGFVWHPRTALASGEFREVAGLLWLQRLVRAWRRRRAVRAR